MINNYHEILETLTASLAGANSMNIIHPFSLHQIYLVEHILIHNHPGASLYYSQFDQQPIQLLPGEFLLIPSQQIISLSCGAKDAPAVARDLLMNNCVDYLTPMVTTTTATSSAGFSFIRLNIEVLEGVSLFDILDLPAFKMTPTDHFVRLFSHILVEKNAQKIVRASALNHAINWLSIEIIRYIFNHMLFTDQLIAKLKYLQDKRVISILRYINKNLSKDLSNQVLANIAHVSEDYMGQYFKLAMHKRPQAYVEYQRMKRAIYLLQTTSKPIHMISQEIGLKDIAYFCRRFKHLFGIQANRARSKDAMMCQL